jgi:DNA-binding transcriptional MerR regulator
MSDDPETERQNDHSYSVNELADEAGVTRRTVHYYIAQGLLPASGTEGRGTRYGQAHLDRLRLNRELQRAHLPLAEIRQRIGRLNDGQVADLVSRDDTAPEPRGSAFEYIQSVLDGTSNRALASMSRQPSPVRPPDTAPPPGLAPNLWPGPAAPAAAPVDPSRMARRLAEAPAAWASDVTTPPFRTPDAILAPPAAAARNAPAPPDPEPSPLTRSQWDRIELAPDVELHVRRPLSRFQNRAVDRLVGIARKLLEEDPS